MLRHLHTIHRQGHSIDRQEHASAGLASHASSDGDCEHYLRSVIQDGDAVTIAKQLLCEVQSDDAMATPCNMCSLFSN